MAWRLKTAAFYVYTSVVTNAARTSKDQPFISVMSSTSYISRLLEFQDVIECIYNYLILAKQSPRCSIPAKTCALAGRLSRSWTFKFCFEYFTSPPICSAITYGPVHRRLDRILQIMSSVSSLHPLRYRMVIHWPSKYTVGQEQGKVDLFVPAECIASPASARHLSRGYVRS